MSQYLTEDEITKYCASAAGVEVADVIIASNLIDGYLGKSFSVNTTTENVAVNIKGRGKLNHSPVIEVSELFEMIQTPISVTKNAVDVDRIYLDEEKDGYFSYAAPINPFVAMPTIFGMPKSNRKLIVTYKYGYETVPDEVKVVTAMLAQSIRQLNSFAGFKRLNTLDYTIEMANPSFFTNDMRAMLSKFR